MMIIDFKYDLGETVNVLEERKNSHYKTGVITECFFNKDGKQYWVKRDSGISWFKENELKRRIKDD
ncbi:MAG: hypothetical protein LBU18_02515 [Treponema sp.]|nr:hypothetical protein [Treponema sp.]